MINVLFVCLGNICRSPAAEAVFTAIIKKEGLQDQILIDSCGTSSNHIGEQADPRMKKHGKDRGYDVSSLSRGFLGKSDFDKFDYIITMDDQNYEDILNWPNATEEVKKKVSKFANYCHNTKVSEVADPYYGGPKDFESTLDVIEDGASELLKQISKKI